MTVWQPYSRDLIPLVLYPTDRLRRRRRSDVLQQQMIGANAYKVQSTPYLTVNGLIRAELEDLVFLPEQSRALLNLPSAYAVIEGVF